MTQQGTPPTVTLAQMEAIARRAARRYAYLGWLQQDDVVQQAMTEMLAALRTFGSQPGNLHGYLTRTAQYAARAFVWETTSPVKHTDRGTLSAKASVLRTTSLDDVSSDELTLRLGATPEDMLHDAHWHFAVQVRFAELTFDDPLVDQTIAWRVLLGNEDSEEVAASEEVSVRAVYVVTQRVRNRILRDAEMNKLLRQR